MSEFLTSHRVDIVKEAPRWTKRKVESEHADERAKKTEIITDTSNRYDSLVSKTVTRITGERDNIKGLKKEFQLLRQLKTTGITPTPLSLKLNQDESQANLLMKKLPGRSLAEIDTSSSKVKEKFNDIVESISRSMETVHKNGVLLVDINKGSFLLENLENQELPVKTNLVDFELAEDTRALPSLVVQDALTRWYRSEDVGFTKTCSQEGFHLTETIARKVEQYMAAKTIIERFLGEDTTGWKYNPTMLPEKEQQVYKAQLRSMKPQIDRRTLVDTYMLQEEKDKQNETIEENSFLKRQAANINLTMINITLPFLLEEKGIQADPTVVTFLQKALSPNLSERPTRGIEKPARDITENSELVPTKVA